MSSVLNDAEPPTVSLILCTYAPDALRLARVFAAIEVQTLPRDRWELLLVDNASPQAVKGPSWPHRLIREPARGLLNARITGVGEARGRLIVFVDDDNLPAPDYLAAAVAGFDAHPEVGTAAGRIDAEWETEPPAWVLQLAGSLAIRNNGDQTIVSPGRHHGPWDPVGAGMVVRTEIARNFAARVREGSGLGGFGRAGRSLGAGEDSLIVWVGYETGWRSAYLPQLRLTHLIPRKRIRLSYQLRLHYALGKSHGQLCLATWMQHATGGISLAGLAGKWREFRSHLGIRTSTCRLLWELGFSRATGTIWSNPPIPMHSSSPPKISVVVPCFNSEATIARTLDSLAAQDYPALEIVVIDGLSKDRTAEIARSYHGLVTTLVSEPDKGQSEAINKGFARATGDILGWLCADDELRPGALFEIARLAVENPDAGIFVGVSMRIFANGTSGEYRPEPGAFEIIGFKNTIDQPATYWRRSLHETAGRIDESLQFAMDWDWWNRLKRAGGIPAFSDRVLANYHFSADNKTSKAPEGNLDETYAILKRHGPLDGHLADVFMFLFRNFDLKGCCDNPPTASAELMQEYWKVHRMLCEMFGEQLIHSYNWNWISKQMRSLTWH